MSQKNAQLSCSFFNYKPVPENGPLNKAPKFLTDIHYIARQKKKESGESVYYLISYYARGAWPA